MVLVYTEVFFGCFLFGRNFLLCIFFLFFIILLLTIFLCFFSSVISLVYMWVSGVLKIFIIGSSFIYLLNVFYIVVSSGDFVVYYIVYSLISLLIYFIFSCLKIFDFINLNLIGLNDSFFFIFVILNYFGVPPFFGFYLKLYMLEVLFNYFIIFFLFFYVLRVYLRVRVLFLIFLNNNFCFVYSFYYLNFYVLYIVFIFLYLIC